MGTWNASQKQIPAKHIICPKCDFEMDNFELNQVKRDIDICQNFKRKYQPRETVHLFRAIQDPEQIQFH